MFQFETLLPFINWTNCMFLSNLYSSLAKYPKYKRRASYSIVIEKFVSVSKLSKPY